MGAWRGDKEAPRQVGDVIQGTPRPPGGGCGFWIDLVSVGHPGVRGEREGGLADDDKEPGDSRKVSVS
ncbi:hypothetical protein AV530_016566 [Patagioenas fasciata monilis]|uniref:Uncharacterized protein n=1 Tax=Patagioenas fasciata monilis TaxID=372326 RepID=A0A1V4J2P8_PATFA|nr:hypothetical protein AV530_016566 [Patagioenas fasciata monilis]